MCVRRLGGEDVRDHEGRETGDEGDREERIRGRPSKGINEISSHLSGSFTWMNPLAGGFLSCREKLIKIFQSESSCVIHEYSIER
jgi:hypothetical protein